MWHARPLSNIPPAQDYQTQMSVHQDHTFAKGLHTLRDRVQASPHTHAIVRICFSWYSVYYFDQLITGLQRNTFMSIKTYRKFP
mmetsp:Transcript_216/g.1627  ORF Transcript_216/g.1627 Transcript_216/m.1627 type:complete len:84 (+) Transcript_216:1576-1827(+)